VFGRIRAEDGQLATLPADPELHRGPAVIGLAVPAVAWLLAAGRYRRSHRRLTRADRDPELPAGGSATAAAALAAVLFGGLALMLVLR
jgi:hypothetical protein